MDALATVEELKLPFELDDFERLEAERALEELSDEARYYGSIKWDSAATTPRQIIRLVLKAAARHMKNYEGYVTSRAGDETVAFSDRGEQMGDASFNAEERKRLGEFAGNYRTTFHSVGVYAYQTRPSRGRVYSAGLVPDGPDPSGLIPYVAEVDDW